MGHDTLLDLDGEVFQEDVMSGIINIKKHARHPMNLKTLINFLKISGMMSMLFWNQEVHDAG